MHKKTVRIIAGVKSRNSCRNLLMKLEILPLPREYIFTLMNFVVNNQEVFQINSAIPSVNTRNRDHLHRHFIFFKKVHSVLASMSPSLPSNLKSLRNKKAQFKVSLKWYINTHPFYYVEEFLTFKNDS
jgi:hypothetical protein